MKKNKTTKTTTTNSIALKKNRQKHWKKNHFTNLIKKTNKQKNKTKQKNLKQFLKIP